MCFCDNHRKGALNAHNDEPICKKCRGPLVATKDFSVSTRQHEYGRQHQNSDYNNYSYGADTAADDGYKAYDAPTLYVLSSMLNVLVGSALLCCHQCHGRD
jgi:NOA36 protein